MNYEHDEKSLSHNENIKEDETIRKPSIIHASILFSINMLLLLFAGHKAQSANFFKGTLFVEYILMFLPAILFLYIFKYDLKKVLRLNRLSFLNAILIVILVLLAIPVVSGVNLVNLIAIKYIFGNVVIVQPPSAYDLPSLLFDLVVVAVTPAICEETMYRGAVMSGFENLGARKAIIMSAFLFGLMHMDFQKMVGIFLLGLLIAYIVYKTNSIFAGMLAHFTNNASSLVLSFAANKLSNITRRSDGVIREKPDFNFSNLSGLPKQQVITALIVLLLVYLFFVVGFAGMFCAFRHNNKGKLIVREKPHVMLKTAVLHSLWLIPGVMVVFYTYFKEAIELIRYK